MTIARRIGLGWTLGINSSTTVALVDGFSGPDATAAVVNTTLLSDAVETFAKGQISPGKLSMTVAYDPNDPVSSSLSSMFTVTNVDPYPFTINYPSTDSSGAGTITVNGHIVGLGMEVAKDKLVTRKVDIQLTGGVGYPGGL